MGRVLRTLHVRAAPGIRTRGVLLAGPLAIPVALGRGGILANKREGDGGTPRGRFRLVRLWWRADRATRPATLLPARRIGPQDAWCEDPADRHYNRHIVRPPALPATGSGATIISMISLSKSAITCGRGSPGGAARCSSTWPSRASRRPPAASQ